MGFAPSAELKAFHASLPRGIRQARKTNGFEYFVFTGLASKILLQVHARVEGCNLVAVTVVHQGRPLEELADAPLFGLAPAGMIDVGVHVGVEAVFVWGGLGPG